MYFLKYIFDFFLINCLFFFFKVSMYLFDNETLLSVNLILSVISVPSVKASAAARAN